MNQTATPTKESLESTWQEISCPGCSRTAAREVFRAPLVDSLAGEGILLCCQSCGLIRLSPCPSIRSLISVYSKDDYYAYHCLEQQPGMGWMGRLKHVLRIMAIKNHSKVGWQRCIGSILTLPIRQRFQGIPSGGESNQMLDVGCGDGFFGSLMQEAGWKVHGIEFHPEGVRRARANGLEVLEGNFLDSEIPWQQLDAVRFWHVLEHLPEPNKVLKRALKLLRPGGELIIGVPNMGSPHRYLFGKCWSGLQLPRHLTFFTSRTLRDIVQQAGFEQITIRHASGGSGLSSWAALFPKKFQRIWMNPVFKLLSLGCDMIFDLVHLGDGLELRARKAKA